MPIPTTFQLPLFACRVSAGFPSPADDYIDKPLDLNDLLVTRPAATLFLWMLDDALQGIPIWPGDLLIADRSITPTPGRLVLARVLGEVLARRYWPGDWSSGALPAGSCPRTRTIRRLRSRTGWNTPSWG